MGEIGYIKAKNGIYWKRVISGAKETVFTRNIQYEKFSGTILYKFMYYTRFLFLRIYFLKGVNFLCI